jgi:hypothetical protein
MLTEDKHEIFNHKQFSLIEVSNKNIIQQNDLAGACSNSLNPTL